ncbi:hypothetical protein [Paenibacillus glycanilyticus]|uniref:Uncharacterized protein n=1 Tax=Paenibacillus glycanilyticus TaxID=126569 RepID=A0ABQ6GFZ3_9BACL|nr:hypothetical protein [Paenibacillus glycanilyticus]GLX69597.1 hypothetical protein MU1_39420 [Paenibacillus glycanilyticus]
MAEARRWMCSVVVLILIIASITGCSTNNTNKAEPIPDADTMFLQTAVSLREIAWQNLNENARKTITGDWREAKVSIVRGSLNEAYPRLRRKKITKQNKKPTRASKVGSSGYPRTGS